MVKLTKKKIALIISVIIAIIGSTSYSFTFQNIQDSNIIQDSENVQQNIFTGNQINTVFGPVYLNQTFDKKREEGTHDGTYYNSTLGFEISTPSPRWDIETNLPPIKIQRTGTPPDKYFLGGAYVFTVSNEHSVLYEPGVLIVVEKDDILRKLTMDGYINMLKKIILNNNPNADVSNGTSFNKQVGILKAIIPAPDGDVYAEQIIRHQNNKTYLIQYHGPSPQIMSEELRTDFNYILNSFHIFP